MFSKMEYDPIMNWNCRNADPAPEQFKSNLPLEKKRQLKSLVKSSMSFDDGFNKDPRNFPRLKQRLVIQKDRSKIGNGEPPIYNQFKLFNKTELKPLKSAILYRSRQLDDNGKVILTILLILY